MKIFTGYKKSDECNFDDVIMKFVSNVLDLTILILRMLRKKMQVGTAETS